MPAVLSKIRSRTLRWLCANAVVAAALGGCVAAPRNATPAQAGHAPPTSASTSVARLPSADVWGGEVRCTADGGCRWVAVEHEASAVVLYALQGRRPRLLDRHGVAYHPDGAKWIDDRYVVAAVEGSLSLDIFSVTAQGSLVPQSRIPVGFSPRDVFVLPARDGGWLLLATPYSGERVAWVHWRPQAPEARVEHQVWCKTPWHITQVPVGPRGQGPGVVTGCMDDLQVLYLPLPSTLEAALATPPQAVRRFDHVPRHVGVSPSGRYWYVALELGQKVARYDVSADVWQMLPFTSFGAVGVAPYDDDTVAWGEDNRVLIIRYGPDGQPLAQRAHPVSGFPTGLQWTDVDGDGQRDLMVMNSAGKASDILFGPLLP